jgi:hypothetical protein
MRKKAGRAGEGQTLKVIDTKLGMPLARFDT